MNNPTGLRRSLDTTASAAVSSPMLFVRDLAGFRYAGFEEFNDNLLLSGWSLRNGPHDPINFALHTGDHAPKVLATRRRFFRLLGINPAKMVSLRQVHGDTVFIPAPQETGRGGLDLASAPEADAVLLTRPGMAAMILTADCVPWFVRVRGRPLAALVHAGWQGARNRILAKTVDLLVRTHQADPKDILVAAGPHIRPCCYEVGEEFASLFPPDCLIRQDGRLRLDLVAAATAPLPDLGIPKTNILDAGLCTACRADLFPSHRRERTPYRMASFILLRPAPRV